ncbi:hypothetical protein MNBD_GAMMA07-193 [hydrothermal vent metagenome]|uniref:M50 family peptidase n=1 Tax=hydrothermal vent metagenome TaxID=652676 RepID=A0A3B0WZD2_9ZZZZ
MFNITPRIQLILFIVLALIIDYLPIVNLPFLWSETFFHEISHGLSALITGGVIQGISLNFNGSGLCTTSGGSHFLISFAGYAGSVVWGLVIYSTASVLSKAKAKYIVATIVLLLTVVLVLWARDIPTITILIILLAMYLTPLFSALSVIGAKYFIQLVGIFVMLDAIRSPLYLLDGRDLGDGAALSQLTWLPEIFWIATWFVFAVSGLLLLWKLAGNTAKDES